MKSSDHPLVTIGIPTFNRSKLLKRAIESALCQEYPCIEILISDNCSSDNTSQVCISYCKRYSRIRSYRHPRCLEPSENFSSLVQRCRGSYIFILADDDFLLPGAISNLVAPILLNSSLTAIASYSAEVLESLEIVSVHKHKGLEVTSKFFQLVCVCNPFINQAYATALYSLFSVSLAKRLYPIKPIRSLSGKSLLMGYEAFVILQILIHGNLQIVPQTLLGYYGPGPRAGELSQAELLARNLSSIDLFSFYFFNYIRFVRALYFSDFPGYIRFALILQYSCLYFLFILHRCGLKMFKTMALTLRL